MKKFFSKINGVKSNFKNVLDNFAELESNINELKQFSEYNDSVMLEKLPTKLRNISKNFAAITEPLTDAKVEASELDNVIPTEFSKLKVKSRILSKQINNLVKNYSDLVSLVDTSKAMVIDAKESYAEPNAEEATQLTDGDANPEAKESFNDGGAKAEESNGSTSVPDGEPQEKINFSLVKCLRNNINNIIKLFSESADDAKATVDMFVDMKDTVCPECGKSPCECEDKEKDMKGFNENKSEEPTETLDELDNKIDDTVENLDEKVEGIEDEEIKSFAKLKLRKIRRMKVTNFSEAEAKIDAIDEANDEIDSKITESVGDEDAESMEEVTEKIDDTTDNLEDKVDAIEDEGIKSFAKQLIRKIRRLKVRNFSDAEKKVDIMEDLNDTLDSKDEDDPADSESTEDMEEITEKIDDTTDNLEDKVDSIEDEEIKSFAKQALRKARRMRVTNFSEAEAKIDALEKVNDDIDAKLNPAEVTSTEKVDATPDGEKVEGEVAEVEFTAEAKTKVNESLKKLCKAVETLEAKCDNEEVKTFSKSVRDLASTECNSMEDAKKKFNSLKGAINMLKKCFSEVGDEDTEETTEEIDAPKEFVEDAEETETPKENETPATEEKPADEPKDEEKVEITDSELALANFSRKGDSEGYGDWLSRMNNN